MKKLLKTVLILFLILVAYSAIRNIVDKVQNPKNKPLYSLELNTTEDYKARLETETSDLEGMSNLDKYELGLNPKDGSDTDGDGLTDKEEIEVYGSDPRKRSTSGDLYTDAYKIEHGMDVNTYYEYEEEVVFAYNNCPEVILTATIEDDLHAVCEPWVITELDGYDVLGNYSLYNYAGVVSIDVSKYLSDDVSVNDIVIFKGLWVGNDLKK